jgi:RNA polymerase sigma-70 factor, ECF subfamily
VHAAPSEGELVEEAKTNPQALGILYRTFEPRITAYVMRRVGDKHEAEDIVADVFLAMVRQLPRYRCAETPFSAWLYRIATNQINYWVRKRRVRSFFSSPPDVVDPRSAPEDDGEQVRLALCRLPLKFQSVLSLYYLEQLAVDEISQVLECPTGTVKSRLARGRDLLHVELLKLRDP